MGDLPYISSEQGGGLIIHTELIYEYTIYKHLYSTPRVHTLVTGNVD